MHPDSVLLITLDSCRYDTFQRSCLPQLRQLAPLHRALAPSYFTYGSHAAMFMGFLPGVQEPWPWLNPKFAKLFRLAGAGWPSRQQEPFTLQGSSIVVGFERLGYHTIGTGAVGWFDPATETGAVLANQFQHFHYPGAVWRLDQQLAWIDQQLQAAAGQPVFLFLNVGETHVPYWHPGAPWSSDDNPCVPFQSQNRRRDCRHRQRACLEYADGLLGPLLQRFLDATTVVTADHGDCWGEDGLWEHGISHRRTLEVPLLMRVKGQPVSPRG
jgi:membrane-anchored protein YejM (alkaline phosphatase superfamily)